MMSDLLFGRTIRWTTAPKPVKFRPHRRTAMAMNRIHAGKPCQAGRRVRRSRRLLIEVSQSPAGSTVRNATKAQASRGRRHNQAWLHDTTGTGQGFQDATHSQTRQFNNVNEPRHRCRKIRGQTSCESGIGI